MTIYHNHPNLYDKKEMKGKKRWKIVHFYTFISGSICSGIYISSRCILLSFSVPFLCARLKTTLHFEFQYQRAQMNTKRISVDHLGNESVRAWVIYTANKRVSAHSFPRYGFRVFFLLPPKYYNHVFWDIDKARLPPNLKSAVIQNTTCTQKHSATV